MRRPNRWMALTNMPGGFWSRDWRRLVQRYGGRCATCGRLPDPDRGERLHRVHVVTRRNGGTNTIGNLLPLCDDCKNYKAGRHLIEVFMYRRRWDKINRALETNTLEETFGPLERSDRVARTFDKMLALAVERGFMRRLDDGRLTPVRAADPDACFCRKQAPHVHGSVVCKYAPRLQRAE